MQPIQLPEFVSSLNEIFIHEILEFFAGAIA